MTSDLGIPRWCLVALLIASFATLVWIGLLAWHQQASAVASPPALHISVPPQPATASQESHTAQPRSLLMILPNPDYPSPRLATCPQRHQAAAMRTALVLLTRRNRTQSEDHDLLAAAMMAWEAARLSSCTRGTIGVGLLLAQVHLALGHNQAATLTAQRVQALARGTPGAALTCVRALAVGAEAWRRLDHPEAAEHLVALGALLAETILDPHDRALALGVELSATSRHT